MKHISTHNIVKTIYCSLQIRSEHFPFPAITTSQMAESILVLRSSTSTVFPYIISLSIVKGIQTEPHSKSRTLCFNTDRPLITAAVTLSARISQLCVCVTPHWTCLLSKCSFEGKYMLVIHSTRSIATRPCHKVYSYVAK